MRSMQPLASACSALLLTLGLAQGAFAQNYPAKPVRTWMRELAWLGRAAQKRTAKE